MRYELSDLFFNHEHQNWQMLFGIEDEPSAESMQEAILEDAKDFCTSYPNFADGHTAEEFADDFFRRL